MANDVELRKIAGELKDLNRNLFHMHRVLKDIHKALENRMQIENVTVIGTEQIPKMVEEIAEVFSETPKKPKSSYDEMRDALEEQERHKRYQNWEERE